MNYTNGLFEINKGNALNSVLQKYSIGAGLAFDGINDFVEASLASNGEITISMVINPVFQNNAYLLSLYNTSNPLPFFDYDSIVAVWLNIGAAERLYFIFRKTPADQIIAVIDLQPLDYANGFMSITMTLGGLSSNDIKVYVNNSNTDRVIARTTTTLSSFVNINKVLFNTVISFGVFTGFNQSTWYDCKIFNKALSSEEIMLLHQTRSMKLPSTAVSNLIANWTFEQKQGTVLFDSSPNAYNGTLFNYTAANTTVGALNSWRDELGNPILQ